MLLLLCLALTPAISQQTPASGQFAPYRPPRMADGHPDLNGIWQAFVSANWDLQDHDAQPGPHPEVMGAYGGGPAGQSVVEVDHPERGKYLTIGNPIKLSDSPVEVRRSPLLGEHTEEILRNLVGMNENDIHAARQQGVI